MTSRIPQAPPPPPPRKPQLPTLGTPSSAASPTASSTIPHEAADLFRKRRTGLLTAGVAIIVGAGAILGAQLKSVKQEHDNLASIMTTDVSPPTTYEPSDVEGGGKDGVGEEKQAKSPRGGSGHTSVNLSGAQVGSLVDRGASSAQRQIAFLEVRRRELMTQKMDLESKLEQVRRDIRKEEEMNAKRQDTGAVADR